MAQHAREAQRDPARVARARLYSVERDLDDGDGNAYSSYYRSRLDIRRAGGGRFRCEDVRSGCAGLSSKDGWNGSYSYLDVANSPE